MRLWLLLAVLAATLPLAGCAPARHYKSALVLQDMAAGKGASITIDAQGEDAEAALAAVLKLIADKFDEGE